MPDTITLTLDDLVNVLREGKAPKRNERNEMRAANIAAVQNGSGIVRIDNEAETFVKGDNRGEVMPPETVAARYSTMLREQKIEGVHVVVSATMALLADDENYIAAVAAL
jgi:hypothetical protein